MMLSIGNGTNEQTHGQTHNSGITWCPISPKLNCLFNSSFKLTSKKTSEICFTCLLGGESTGDWWIPHHKSPVHYTDVKMSLMASQITSLTVVNSTFIQTQIKENIKAPRHWPLCGEFTGTGEFPAQRASYAENVSIWWRHHELSISIAWCHHVPT